jgi:hypothetical protein
MAVSLSIDTEGIFNQKQVFTLNGIKYIIKTYYNNRVMDGEEDTNGSWYISIYDVDNNPILTGLKCMPNRDMIARNPDGNFLNGLLSCVDTTPDDPSEDIEIDNFGQNKRYQLWFLTAADFVEFI